jgi:hypothetical protein
LRWEMIEPVVVNVGEPISASRLVALLGIGDVDSALKINVALADEMPFAEVVEDWCVEQIKELADVEDARRVWHEAKAKADPALREIAEEAFVEWHDDRTALRGKARLANLVVRLEVVKPKLVEVNAQIRKKIFAAAEELAAAERQPKQLDLEEAIEEAEQVEVAREVKSGELWLPGLAGEIQDYYLRTAMQPSQIISLSVGLMVPTVLISGSVTGPSGPKGCALQQTLVVLAPTSGGKQWAIDIVKECINKSGAKTLLGPNRFKSGPALVRWVKEHRVSLCVQDEFGRLLAKLGDPKCDPHIREINDRMREFWAMGPESVYNSPIGAEKGDDSEMIVDPRLSILGFGIKDEFFQACKDMDVINGFLNRIAVLEEPKMIRPRTDFDPAEFPFGLMSNLNKLQGCKTQKLAWGAGAKDLYEAELDRVYSETDERKLKLWSRTPEKIVRAASVFASCRYAKVVERSDMEIAQAFLRLSDEVFKKGIDEAERQRELGHAELRREIIRRIRDDFDGAASAAQLRRSFRHNTKHKDAIDDALTDMVKTETLEKGWIETGGRKKEVYKLKQE